MAEPRSLKTKNLTENNETFYGLPQFLQEILSINRYKVFRTSKFLKIQKILIRILDYLHGLFRLKCLSQSHNNGLIKSISQSEAERLIKSAQGKRKIYAFDQPFGTIELPKILLLYLWLKIDASSKLCGFGVMPQERYPVQYFYI
ncbi:hypothetical protein CVS40_2012 [Lucilia cuprina]|nr:hypothetical protein CVS40_2012 [Lucilia cuprina]